MLLLPKKQRACLILDQDYYNHILRIKLKKRPLHQLYQLFYYGIDDIPIAILKTDDENYKNDNFPYYFQYKTREEIIRDMCMSYRHDYDLNRSPSDPPWVAGLTPKERILSPESIFQGHHVTCVEFTIVRLFL